MKKFIFLFCLTGVIGFLFCFEFPIMQIEIKKFQIGIKQLVPQTYSPKVEKLEKKVGTCDYSGTRKANVVTNVGVGDRSYLAYTNDSSQLVKVEAKEIKIKTNQEHQGRYCNDEANVNGTQSRVMDKGHAIADSLGGVSNAYNITPQHMNVNRRGGEQYRFEDYIRNSIRKGRHTLNFSYLISYPNKQTQTPSSYDVKFIDSFRGSTIEKHMNFKNIMP